MIFVIHHLESSTEFRFLCVYSTVFLEIMIFFYHTPTIFTFMSRNSLTETFEIIILMFYVIAMYEHACSVRSELGLILSKASEILVQIIQRYKNF